MAKAKAVAQKKGKGKQAGKAMDSNLMDTPMGKGKTPTDAPKGKGKGKGSLKIDIMLMKAMPGVGPDGKPIKGKGKLPSGNGGKSKAKNPVLKKVKGKSK